MMGHYLCNIRSIIARTINSSNLYSTPYKQAMLYNVEMDTITCKYSTVVSENVCISMMLAQGRRYNPEADVC